MNQEKFTIYINLVLASVSYAAIIFFKIENIESDVWWLFPIIIAMASFTAGQAVLSLRNQSDKDVE